MLGVIDGLTLTACVGVTEEIDEIDVVGDTVNAEETLLLMVGVSL